MRLVVRYIVVGWLVFLIENYYGIHSADAKATPARAPVAPVPS
jgi:hypothetical protein